MTRVIEHHPDAATLMSFAAGTLAEPPAAVVASHASLCPVCRGEIALLERLGGALLDDVKPLGDLRAPPLPASPIAEDAHACATSTGDRLPYPIARHFKLTFGTIPWRRLGPGVWHHRLPLSHGVDGDLRLLKISGDCRMPEHGHGGEELTLVLDGAYIDETGRYGAGDVQDVDQDVEHRPIAEAAGCVCLIASEHPAHFRSLIGRLMQPWTRM
jgi:putative transcriptional regulator